MSGGHFDYKQDHITEIADAIQEVIDNKVGDYSAPTLQELTIAVSLLRESAIYAQRIDWLLSGDDGEDTFHHRLNEELAQMPHRRQ